MSAVLTHPIFARLESDMQRMGLQGADLSNVTDLRAERVRREREASQRRCEANHSDFNPEPAA